MSIRKSFILIAALFALLLVASGTLAQDDVITLPTATPVVSDPPPLGEEITRADAQAAPPVIPDQIVKPAEVFAAILALLGMFAAGVGPLAQVVTSAYKFVTVRWFPESTAAAALPVVAVIVPVVLTVLFWIADVFELSELYVVVANNLVTIIPLVLSMLGALAGQAFMYERVWKPLNAPVVGKHRYQLMSKAHRQKTQVAGMVEKMARG